MIPMIPIMCISIESMIPMILYTFKTSVLLFVERLPIADRGCCQSAAGCPSHFSGGKSWEILGPSLGKSTNFLDFLYCICTIRTYMEKLKKTMETLKKTMEKLKQFMDKLRNSANERV